MHGVRNLHHGRFGHQGNHVTGGSYAERFRDEVTLDLDGFDHAWCTSSLDRLRHRARTATGVDAHWTAVGIVHLERMQTEWLAAQTEPTTADDVTVKVAAARAAAAGDPDRFTVKDADGWDVPTADGLAAEAAVTAAGAAVHARALTLLDTDALADVGRSKIVADQLRKLGIQVDGPVEDRDSYVALLNGRTAELTAARDRFTATPTAENRWTRSDIVEHNKVAKAVAYEVSRVRHGECAWDLAESKVWSDAYVAALSEQRELGMPGGLPIRSDLPPSTLHNPKARTRFTSDQTAINKLNRAAQVLPRDWLEAQQTGARLVAKSTSSRAHYSEGSIEFTSYSTDVEAFYTASAAAAADDHPEAWVRVQYGTTQVLRPDGHYVQTTAGDLMRPPPHYPAPAATDPAALRSAGWQPAEVVRRQVRRQARVTEEAGWLTVDASPSALGSGVDTALHELQHRIDKRVPRLNRLAVVHRARRTMTGGRHDPLEGYDTKGKGWPSPPTHRSLAALSSLGSEWVRSDGFAERYAGKVYPDHFHATEINSLGVEAVLAGSRGGFRGHKADDEHRNFILGLLASC